jgi:hypothetical protein
VAVAAAVSDGPLPVGDAIAVGVCLYRAYRGIQALKAWFEASQATDEDGAPERTIDDPGSLEGATTEEVEAAVPEGWVKGDSRTGGGTRWLNPEKPGEAVRIQPGNARDPNPVKRGPYVRVSKDGTTSDPVPLNGNPTLPPP